jgi:hypothetical protein
MQCTCAILSSVEFFHIISQMAWLQVGGLNTKCVFWFSLQLLTETFLFLRRNERDMIKKCIFVFKESIRYSCPILWDLNFLDRFSKNPHISNFTKIRPAGAELFHADGWTDMTKLIVTFHNFVNVPKKHIWVYTTSFICSVENLP